MSQASKYRNQKTVIDAIEFDSRKEGRRYQELKLMVRSGLIRDIELQPRYDLIVNGQKVGFYKADFRYKDVATGLIIVEDVKGMRTAVYMLKKKLVKALYGVDIVEV